VAMSDAGSKGQTMKQLWRPAFLILLFCGPVPAQDGPAKQALRGAIELQRSGHYAEAIDAYRTFLKAHPDVAAVRSNLGAALVHEGHYSDAIREYTLALKADPSNYGIRFNLGLAYFKTGDLAHAANEFEAVYSGQPESDPIHERVALLLAECELRQGNNDRVAALLDPIAVTDHNNPTLNYLLGTALLRDDQIERGTPFIQRLLENGETAEGHMLMAYTRWAAHDKAGALAEVKRVIELNPNLPEAYSLGGRLTYLETDMKGAEVWFRKALDLDANNFDALVWLGTLLREEGDLQDSEKDLTRALELRPAEMRARFQFAHLCSDEGDDKRAVTLLEALVKDHPEYTEAHRTLATVYFRLGRADDGRRERKVAEQMDAAIQKRDQEKGRSMTK
jgi:tetratricopeptide (TPR) repeat protein